MGKASSKAAAKPAARHVQKRPSFNGGRSRAASLKTTLLPEQPEAVQLLPVQPPSSMAEVTLASDCSGLCTEGPAARVNLPPAVTVKHVYTSEIEPKFRTIGLLKIIGIKFFFRAMILTLQDIHCSVCSARAFGGQYGEHTKSGASLV